MSFFTQVCPLCGVSAMQEYVGKRPGIAIEHFRCVRCDRVWNRAYSTKPRKTIAGEIREHLQGGKP